MMWPTAEELCAILCGLLETTKGQHWLVCWAFNRALKRRSSRKSWTSLHYRPYPFSNAPKTACSLLDRCENSLSFHGLSLAWLV